MNSITKQEIRTAFNNTNVNLESGIHYGVILTRTLDQDAMNRIYENNVDTAFEEAEEQAKNDMVNFEEPFALAYVPQYLREEVKAVIRAIPSLGVDEEKFKERAWEIVNDFWSDNYESDGESWRYEDEDVTLTSCLLGAIMVLESKYYTLAPRCSPCVPNAGDLDSTDSTSEKVMTYCLPPKWFTDDKPPYTCLPVTETETNL